MFRTHVVPLLEPLPRVHRHQIRLRTFGLPESQVNDRLAGVEATFNVTIGYRASLPEIEVKVLAEGESAADAAARAQAAAAEVRVRLGSIVYGEGITFAGALIELCAARGLTLALAESCTGGLAAELITSVPGSSRVFRGGVVAYDNAVKTALLGVDAELIRAHGAVSTEVARAMAEGARRRLDAGVALSFTGIAGPDGGTAEKPVGLVHFAVSTDTRLVAAERVFPGTREQVRRRAVFAGFSLLRRELLQDLPSSR